MTQAGALTSWAPRAPAPEVAASVQEAPAGPEVPMTHLPSQAARALGGSGGSPGRPSTAPSTCSSGGHAGHRAAGSPQFLLTRAGLCRPRRGQELPEPGVSPSRVQLPGPARGQRDHGVTSVPAAPAQQEGRWRNGAVGTQAQSLVGGGPPQPPWRETPGLWARPQGLWRQRDGKRPHSCPGCTWFLRGHLHPAGRLLCPSGS